MPCCINCGNEVIEGATFCTKCGIRLRKESAAEVSQLQKKGSDGKVAGLVFGIIGSLVITFAGIDMALIRSVSGDTIMEAYYNAMGRGFIGLGIFCIVITSLVFASKSK